MLLGACNAEPFDLVLCRTQSCGVDQAQGNALDADLLLDDVPRGAGHVGDDGTLRTEEGVEEAGFADVRTADDDGLDPHAQDASRVCAREEFLYGSGGIADIRAECGGGCGRDVVLGEVDARLDACNRAEQARADRCDLARECARQTLPRGAGSTRTPRVDKLHNALGARKVESSIQKGAFCELPRCSRTCTRLPCTLEDGAQDDCAAVALELDGVLARIGVWRTHKEEDALVDDGAVRRDDVPIACRVRRDLPKRPAHGTKYRTRNVQCVCSAHTNDADAARSLRGGDLADGVLGHAFPFPFLKNVGKRCAV